MHYPSSLHMEATDPQGQYMYKEDLLRLSKGGVNKLSVAAPRLSSIYMPLYLGQWQQHLKVIRTLKSLAGC